MGLRIRKFHLLKAICVRAVLRNHLSYVALYPFLEHKYGFVREPLRGDGWTSAREVDVAWIAKNMLSLLRAKINSSHAGAEDHFPKLKT